MIAVEREGVDSEESGSDQPQLDPSIEDIPESADSEDGPYVPRMRQGLHSKHDHNSPGFFMLLNFTSLHSSQIGDFGSGKPWIRLPMERIGGRIEV